MKKLGGLRRRWLTNTFMVVVPLAVVCVLLVTASFSAYYYSGMESDLRYRAKTTKDYFEDNINFDYSKFYQSCVDFTKTYEERNHIELQFINAYGHMVASSYGPWAGRTPSTGEIQEAMTTRTMSTFLGVDPHTGEHIMAVSAPLIYHGGEIIGVLRFVTSTRVMNMQIAYIVLITVFFCVAFLTVLLLTSNYYIHSILVPIADITETAKRITGAATARRSRKSTPMRSVNWPTPSTKCRFRSTRMKRHRPSSFPRCPTNCVLR